MGLNDIELPASVIISLYPTALVTTGTEETAAPVKTVTDVQAESPAPSENTLVAAPPAFTWRSLGNNEKNILVVVNHAGINHLPDEDLGLLTNMLTACKLGLGDIALINFDHYLQTGGNAVLKHFKSRNVLLFGIEPAEFGLPVSFPAFQVQGVANVQYLFSPALAKIANDKAAKTQLWGCLKKLFGI